MILALEDLKEKEEKRKARFTRRDKDVAQECPDCEGFGYHFNNDSQLGEMCSNCIQGWVIKDSDDVISTLTDETFERGVKLGAGVAVGFSLISLGAASDSEQGLKLNAGEGRLPTSFKFSCKMIKNATSLRVSRNSFGIWFQFFYSW